MARVFVKSKIHQAVVTQTDLRYEGSITLDTRLMEKADIVPYEQVHVLNLNNGTRIETYAIEGRKPGVVCMNGAAARHAEKGDQIIILTYQTFSDRPPKSYKPTVVFVDGRNKVKKVKKGA